MKKSTCAALFATFVLNIMGWVALTEPAPPQPTARQNAPDWDSPQPAGAAHVVAHGAGAMRSN